MFQLLFFLYLFVRNGPFDFSWPEIGKTNNFLIWLDNFVVAVVVSLNYYYNWNMTHWNAEICISIESLYFFGMDFRAPTVAVSSIRRRSSPATWRANAVISIALKPMQVVSWILTMVNACESGYRKRCHRNAKFDFFAPISWSVFDLFLSHSCLLSVLLPFSLARSRQLVKMHTRFFFSFYFI